MGKLRTILEVIKPLNVINFKVNLKDIDPPTTSSTYILSCTHMFIIRVVLTLLEKPVSAAVKKTFSN